MSLVVVQRTVSHSPDRVWAALADFGGVHRFHPLVARSPVPEGKPDRGLGAERTCHFYDGNSVVERVVEYADGQHMAIDIVEGSMPLACAKARLEIGAAGPGRTHVRMEMDYRPKFGVLGRAMDALMMKRRFTGMITSLLAALDHHLTTGEDVDASFRAAAA